MTRLEKCLHLYIGCETNKGRFVGFRKGCLLIQPAGEEGIAEYNTDLLGSTVFLYLRQLNSLSEEQSRELIKRGMNIGRPSGYSFSTESFLFLLSLSVDLYGLIRNGVAKEIGEA